MKVTINRVAHIEGIIWRRIGDDIVIIREDGLATHALNKTAAFIWEQCDSQCNIDDIAARLCERFDVSLEEAKADVREIIEKWLQAEIIKPVEEMAIL